MNSPRVPRTQPRRPADTYHTSRFLVFWLLLLPFTLYTELGWGALPIAPVVTFLIFGVAEIAIDLEEPFSILPLDAICDKVCGCGCSDDVA